MSATQPRTVPQRIGRIALWALAAIAALVVALALSIWIAGFGSAERLTTVTNTTIPGTDGNPDVRAYVAYPPPKITPDASGTARPAVIMVHEFWGLNDSITGKAELLAEQGYVVVAPDVMRGRTTGYIPRAIWQTITNDPEAANADIDSVVAWLGTPTPDRVDAERIAITGFCFGGRTSMLYSLHNPTLRGTAVFYGNPVLDPERLKALQGPVLGIFGGADQSIPLEDVRAFEAALKQAGVESTVTVYPNQPHAFVESAEGIAADPAQAAAWEQLSVFLGGALASTPPTGTGSAPQPQPAGDGFGLSHAIMLGLGHVGHAAPAFERPADTPGAER